MSETGTQSAMGNKAHFIGICGAGMSAVALLLRESGWQISGSDAGFYPPISDLLTAQNIPCLTPYAPENIPADANLIIIGKHAKLVPASNEEVAEAFRRRNVGKATILSYPEVMQMLTHDTRNIVVAGSYGKSTTTALLAHLLRETERDPSYFIGAIPLDFDANAHRGTGDLFVLEGDEYPASNWDATPKFLYYNAQTVLFTSGEHDHFNEFKTEAEYLDTYRRLVRSLPPDSLLVACLDGQHVPEVIQEAKCRVVTYATTPNSGADWTAQIEAEGEDNTRFTVRHGQANNGDGNINDAAREPESGHFVTQLLGRHNVQNLLGAITTLREVGALTLADMNAPVASFRGLRRRLEPKTQNTSVWVYEDLSSSRPKAMAALSAVRARHPQAKVIAVFQPHTFSFRSRKALEWYPGMFADADSVLVFSPPALRGLATEEQLSHDEIMSAIRDGNSSKQVTAVRDEAETLTALRVHLDPGDVIALMTSGGMGGVIASIVDMVESFPNPPAPFPTSFAALTGKGESAEVTSLDPPPSLARDERAGKKAGGLGNDSEPPR